MTCQPYCPFAPSLCPLPRWGRGEWGLLSFELRLALLVERSHAFEPVLGGDGDIVGLDGERHARFEVGLASPVDGLFRLADRDGAIGGDGGGDLERLRTRLA